MSLYVFKKDGLTMDNYKLKNRIRMCRAEKGISQEDLGKGIHVTRQTIAVLEQGRQEPTLTIALKIACYFHKSIEDIFYYERQGDT